MKERILVVANRLPVAIQVTERSFHFQPSPGGLASALSALNDSYELQWIGWPGEVDLSMIQPESIDAELKKEYNASAIFLTRRQLNRYYFGFSNRVLWPVLHYLPTHIDYDEKDFRVYREVNRIFAERIIQELQSGKTDDIVWIHDYQLMLVPAMVRERVPEARIGFFLHTPFPSSEMYRALPYRKELLKGLLGSNLIGFQTHSGLRHFRSSLLHILGLDSEINRIDLEDHSVQIGAYPISVDPAKIDAAMQEPDFEEDLRIVRQIKKGRKMILSVDRLDYTKGIPERLSAYKKFLERNPEKAAEVVLVQVAVPSRTKIPDYRHLKDQVEVIVMDIIEAHETLPDSPIQFMYRSLPFRRLAAFYSEADVALVTPYFDGMNLVAKEYVAVKKDHGVLILSELAGASSELGEAIIINPWNRDQISDALETALELSQDECTRRMSAMYERVRR
ncbi:MAG: trehalose-6-phosphate synthase, partial [Leptospiraceae bacterium]|nr:trehalose-6-phosphate synthase [Leptospiraceae bacterium]